jgi:CelD/BcsL family acetyltransferase involved in cellulose biosynthesis
MQSVAYETFDHARTDWAALAERVDADPFHHPGWFAAWHGAFGERELRVLTARRDGELVAALPLESGRVGRAPTNEHTPRFGAVCLDSRAAGALARHLWRSGPRRTEVEYVEAAHPLVDALMTFVRPSALRLDASAHQPYADLRAAPDAYEAAMRSKLRSDLRRRWRRLTEAGAVEYAVHDGRTDLDALLAEGFEVEAASWKGANGTAIASNAESIRFYTDVARWAADKDWLRLAYIRVDGRAIAFSLFLEASSRIWALKLGVDPEYRTAGPGSLMTWQSIKHWTGRGLKTFEFLGDADEFKLTWADATREVQRVRLFSARPAGVATAAWWRQREAALRGARRVRNGLGVARPPVEAPLQPSRARA